MTIPILYEDSDFLIVNKPAGLVVHFDGKTKEYSVADWVLEKFPEIKGVGEPLKLSNGMVIDRPGIVHRIDRETSGALVIARNQKAFEYLKDQFQNRNVEKTYHAFVYGELKNDEGIIDKPIGRSKNDFRKWTAERGARGEIREAITEYKVLLKNNGYSFVEVKPKTGRTHQIRVHFKALQYPVVADKLYASSKKPALGFDRLALHARAIHFQSPSKKDISALAPYPKDFEKALELLKKA